jgi:hypothetical protein
MKLENTKASKHPIVLVDPDLILFGSRLRASPITARVMLGAAVGDASLFWKSFSFGRAQRPSLHVCNHAQAPLLYADT